MTTDRHATQKDAMTTTPATAALPSGTGPDPDSPSRAGEARSTPAQRAGSPREPRQVLLFSGHMVDAPDRPQPRFPPRMVPAAARRIAEVLDGLQAGPDDLALC